MENLLLTVSPLMKKTFFLIGALGLLTSAGIAHGSDERVWIEKIWDDVSDVGTTTLGQDDKLIIQLGSTENSTEVDLGSISIRNNVITTTGGNAAISSAVTPDDPDASFKTYTYGALHLADDANVKLSGNNTDWSYTGTLSLGEKARLHLDKRYLAVTGLPYASMGAGSEIVLSAPDAEGTSRGFLSFGPSNQNTWDALTVEGAYGEAGYVRNTSDSVATLGTETAVDVEYVNTVLTVQGDEVTTPIVAKMGNAAIINQSKGDGTIVVSGGVAAGFSTAVTQVNTGVGESTGGDIVLLNRGSEVQKMDSLLIGLNRTVAAKQGNADSEAAVIEINAYDVAKDYDVVNGSDGAPGLLVMEEGAALDADLILGTGNVDEAVLFVNGYALDMCGNDVTLDSGIMIYDPSWYGTERLLFTNVDTLTLGNVKYDNKYFDYHYEIEAGEFFSSNYENYEGWLTSVELPTFNADGTRTGWFIEYRDNGNGTGNVYLTYNTVPEPTTATLSLLALAGLAARRRRK